MAFYLCLMTFIAAFGAVLCREGDGRKAKLYVTMCFAALTLIAAVRSANVGVDTGQFTIAYTLIGMTPWEDLGSTFRYEWGFLILCKLLNYVSSDPQLLLVVSSLIINVPVGIFIYRNSPRVELSIFLYVALTLFTMNMNIMREAMAVSIVLIAFEMLKKGYDIWFLVLVGAATGFHQTAPFLLILWPLWRIDFNRRSFLVYCVLALILFFFSHQVSDLLAALLGRDEIYRDEYTGSNYFGALLKALLAVFVSAIVLNYFRVGKKRGLELSRAESFYCHMLMLWVLFSILGMQIQIFSRLCMYFNIFAVVGIACALRFIESKGERAFIELLIGAIALCYFVVIGVSRPEWQGVIPYEVSASVLHLISVI